MNYKFEPPLTTVIFSVAVMEFLRGQRQMKAGAVERGGVLLGTLHPETKTIVVTKAVPSVRASASTHSIEPNLPELQRKIEKEWEKGGRLVTYLGDWHTHPEPFPAPSWTDRCTFTQNYFKSSISSDHMLYAIVGQSESIEDWWVALWKHLGGRRPLRVVDESSTLARP